MRHLVVSTIFVFAVLQGQVAHCQDTITKEKRSPPKPAGQGRDYSEWYVLESDPAPPGYYVSDTQFKLAGRHACGVSAQCLEGERTPQQSTWLFRIQGSADNHDGVTTDVAVLITTYRKAGTESNYTLTVTTPEKFSSRGAFFGCFDTAKAAVAGDGPWCFISATRPKRGYRIKSVSFALQGDRSCVGNDSDRQPDEPTAWCRLVTRTDEEAIWEFKMSGHIEEGDDSAKGSFATLTAVYEKTPATNPADRPPSRTATSH